MMKVHENLEYSVLLPVYCKEKPGNLKKSIDSMLLQSCPPKEIVIVEDGPLPAELETVVKAYEWKYPDLFLVQRNVRHTGLGETLRLGVLLCGCDYIARMDSDDISELDRIEQQWEVMKNHPELDIVGSVYDEFLVEGQAGPIRTLPENPEELLAYAHKRNPFGHSSLLVKKKAIVSAGNYRDYPGIEDYELYVRMFLNGSKGYNIQKPLVHVRAGEDFYNRRGGVEYLKKQKKFFKEYLDKGFFTSWEYYYTLFARTVVSVVPGETRSFIYRNFLRKSA